ncbi:MAG: ATP-binding protein [Actinomycetota bacterium]|nr:ATP-binding protein [Actinomycetota bacterium]
MTSLWLAVVCSLLGIALVLMAVRLRQLTRTSSPENVAPVLPSPRDEHLEIFEKMATGVLLLNEALTPVMANPAAAKLLQLPGASLPARLRSDELVSISRRAIAEDRAVDADVTLWPGRTEVRIRAVPLADRGEVALFLQDVTEETRTQQIRRQFVVNASHELKSPVAGLQALAEAVAQAIDDDPETAKRFTEKLIGESERLGRLIQDLLDLSRVEDPVHFSDEQVDLAEVAEHETTQLKDRAERAGVEMVFDGIRGVRVRGDEQQLGLMVRNLIDNAIRYTPTGGLVQIRIDHDATDVRLEVEDSGIGIPLQAQARVFERFFRVDGDRARDSGGTGLGLSIVKHVAELHGGHVGVQSELGEGSTFLVRLPLAHSGS